ncbi:VOC family protein [Peterkaempfera bronchialis]|uniref:VOC family protein n=1 Tax=Peterkaempfera bronchialis TaxID=2126346 RepID=UPI003C30A187
MHASLIVVFTERLGEVRDFYIGLGFDFAEERHGTGPVHYAAVLDGGVVFELYPAGRRPPTGYLRLGFAVRVGAVRCGLVAGRHVLTDPDGRTVDLDVQP